MINIINQVERVSDELKLSLKKDSKLLLYTSGGQKRFFDVIEFNNGEFYICVFNNDCEFAIGGACSRIQLPNLFCPSHKGDESIIYTCIMDVCKSLIKRDHLINLFIQQNNVDDIKNELKSLSVNELTSFFNLAAFHGRLEICKLIYKTARFMHASHAMIFACQEGELDTAKWLYSIGGDPHFKDCKCLKHVLCRIEKDKYKMEYYDVVDWLCEIIHPHSLKKYSIPHKPIFN